MECSLGGPRCVAARASGCSLCPTSSDRHACSEGPRCRLCRHLSTFVAFVDFVAFVAYPWTSATPIAKEGSMILCAKLICESVSMAKPDGRTSEATKSTKATHGDRGDKWRHRREWRGDDTVRDSLASLATIQGVSRLQRASPTRVASMQLGERGASMWLQARLAS